MCIMEHLEVLEYSGIFISNPVYRNLFRNNCERVKRYASVYTFRHTPDLLQPTAFAVLFPVFCFNCYTINWQML